MNYKKFNMEFLNPDEIISRPFSLPLLAQRPAGPLLQSHLTIVKASRPARPSAAACSPIPFCHACPVSKPARPGSAALQFDFVSFELFNFCFLPSSHTTVRQDTLKSMLAWTEPRENSGKGGHVARTTSTGGEQPLNDLTELKEQGLHPVYLKSGCKPRG